MSKIRQLYFYFLILISYMPYDQYWFFIWGLRFWEKRMYMKLALLNSYRAWLALIWLILLWDECMIFSKVQIWAQKRLMLPGNITEYVCSVWFSTPWLTCATSRVWISYGLVLKRVIIKPVIIETNIICPQTKTTECILTI